MFSLNGTLKKSGSVGRWEMKHFIGVALFKLCLKFNLQQFKTKLAQDIAQDISPDVNWMTSSLLVYANF